MESTSGGNGVFDPATLSELPPKVDGGQPTTSIAVRLPNGQRKVVKVNVTMTVQQVAAQICRNQHPFKSFRDSTQAVGRCKCYC
jgi:hypothetical protein